MDDLRSCTERSRHHTQVRDDVEVPVVWLDSIQCPLTRVSDHWHRTVTQIQLYDSEEMRHKEGRKIQYYAHQ